MVNTYDIMTFLIWTIWIFTLLEKWESGALAPPKGDEAKATIP
jgi:hypothetical protein